MPLDGVPTAGELIRMGLARQHWDSTKIEISDEGHALLGQKLREAAERSGPMTAEKLRTTITNGKAEAKNREKKK